MKKIINSIVILNLFLLTAIHAESSVITYNILVKSQSGNLDEKWEQLKDWAYQFDNNDLKFSDLRKEITFITSFNYHPNVSTKINELVSGKIVCKMRIWINSQGNVEFNLSEFELLAKNQQYLYPFNYKINSKELIYEPVELNRDRLEEDYQILPANLDEIIFCDLKAAIDNFREQIKLELAREFN